MFSFPCRYELMGIASMHHQREFLLFYILNTYNRTKLKFKPLVIEVVNRSSFAPWLTQLLNKLKNFSSLNFFFLLASLLQEKKDAYFSTNEKKRTNPLKQCRYNSHCIAFMPYRWKCVSSVLYPCRFKFSISIGLDLVRYFQKSMFYWHFNWIYNSNWTKVGQSQWCNAECVACIFYADCISARRIMRGVSLGFSLL